MNLKTFAQESRNILMEGVAKKLLYWGFDEKGNVLEEPHKVPGGYMMRGEPFDDPSVPDLWMALKSAIQKKGLEVVVEEAAYTWFNRMMAIKILAKTGYNEPQLNYVDGMQHTPVLLQRARQGHYDFLKVKEQERLKKIIGDYNKDQEVFAQLLTGYCHSHPVLNRIFGKLDDYTELLLPDNMLQDQGFLHLLNTTDAISEDEYKTVELIGWLYQFYISEKKDEVFASFKKNKKAEAKDIPAATQIFTPNWIVKYMVENTAGKIWLDKNPSSPIKSQLKYLVENESDGTSEAIIDSVEELTLIDPAAGSGHILVEGFDLIYQMYMEEYYTPEEAVASILKNNLFGLDIDDRAAQLATFAVLLKAAKVYSDVWTKDWLPQVYAMPEAQNFGQQELKDFLGTEGLEYLEELDDALRLMKQAKNLGSVMTLNLSNEARNFIKQRFTVVDDTDYRDFNLEVVYQKLKAYIPVLLILTKKYSSVVANPPYMGQKSMNGELKDYVNTHYPVTKSDLMTIFMEVIPNLTADDSRFALINLPSWLFLSSFEKIRQDYIDNFTFDSLLHMGRGIFGIDFGSVAFAIKKTTNKDAIGNYFKLHERNFQHIYYEDIEKLFLYSNNNEAYKYDFAQYRGDEGITEIPKQGTTKGLKLFYPNIPQTNFSKIPGSPIAYWASKKAVQIFEKNNTLEEIGLVRQGASTSDNNRFLRFWHEVNFEKIGFSIKSLALANQSNFKWFPYNKGGSYRKWSGNFDNIINYQNDGFELKKFQSTLNQGWTVRLKSREYYFISSVSWPKISSGKFSARYYPDGFIFDVAGCCYFPKDEKLKKVIVAYLNSNVSKKFLEFISPTLNYEIEQIKRLPFIDSEKYYSFNFEKVYQLSLLDWDCRETSWDFELSPLLNETSSLDKAYTKWHGKVTQDFFQLHTHEEELNRIFIDIYGLQEELRPEVPLKDITILQEELDRKELERLEPVFREQGKEAMELPIDKSEVISQFISYGIGLFMGRYRLDKPGLNIAHPNPAVEELASYTYKGDKITIDEDAILPLMGSRCSFSDDAVHQFQGLLDTIWGRENRTENINFIQECLDKDLEKFLVKDFYKYHCGMYKKKPIYWLFSSKKGAFQVLVYMHRMNAFTAEKIRANYLLEHIKHLHKEESILAANESNLSTQEARKLDQIRKDITECEAYDLELKNVADQQIEIDLDDGVTVNYAKFQPVLAKIK